MVRQVTNQKEMEEDGFGWKLTKILHAVSKLIAKYHKYEIHAERGVSMYKKGREREEKKGHE